MLENAGGPRIAAAATYRPDRAEENRMFKQNGPIGTPAAVIGASGGLWTQICPPALSDEGVETIAEENHDEKGCRHRCACNVANRQHDRCAGPIQSELD
jgi:hypothetical protein